MILVPAFRYALPDELILVPAFRHALSHELVLSLAIYPGPLYEATIVYYNDGIHNLTWNRISKDGWPPMSDEELTREQLLALAKDLRQRLAQSETGQLLAGLRGSAQSQAISEDMTEQDQEGLVGANQQLAAINRMGQMVSASLDLELVLAQLTSAVPALVGAEGVSILLLEDGAELVFAAASGDGAQGITGLRIPADAGVAGAVLKNRKSYLVGDPFDQGLIYRPIEQQSGYHTQSLLAVPLLSEGEVIGVMEAVHAQPGKFSRADLQMLEAAASWAATAIGNARRHTTTQRRLQESQALSAISQALNETFELDRILRLIVDAAREIIPHVERAVIHLYQPEDDSLLPTATSGVEHPQNPQITMRLGQGIAGLVMQRGDPINIRDTESDERFLSLPGSSDLRSLLVSPVQSGERRLGTLSVSSGQMNAFSDEDERLLTLLAVQAALAIEGARLFTETQQRARHLALLNEITRAALQTPDLDSLLRMLANWLGQLFGAESCIITLWDESQQIVTPVAVYGQLADGYSLGARIDPEKALTVEILKAEHPLVIDDRQTLDHLDERISRQFPSGTILGIPLVAGSHRLGAAVLGFDPHRRISKPEVENAESIAQQLALAIYKALLLKAEQTGRQEAETLRQVTAALTATLDLDQVLESILVQLDQAISHDSAAVFLAERDILSVVAARGFEQMDGLIGSTFPQDIPLYQEIKARRQPIILADALADRRWADWSAGAAIRGWMGVPLVLQDEVLGYLTLDSGQVGAFDHSHAALAQAFANQAAIAIQNARLFTATNRRLQEVNTLYHISNQIVAAADVQVADILQEVVNLLWEDFGYYHVHVYLFDQDSGALIAQQGSGPVGALLTSQGYQLTSDEGIVGYVATLGEAFMSNDVRDVHFYKSIDALPAVCGELAAPLRARDQILGVLDVLHQPPNEFDEDDFRFLTAVADQLAVVLDKAMLYNELQAALSKEQTTRNQLVQTEKLAAMGRLIASVAHELNNPLQAIQNALFLVKSEASLSPQAREDLQVALGETARMADLIARLRDTYRPSRLEDFRPASLNDLVRDVQRLIATHVRHNHVSLVFKPDLALPDVPLIRDQIK
ncbi:MAG: GAF domain-containing protein, partial [Anaerolineales bacterium]|nr:GAF domain-containing protein [Anaerolineales bacterium]